MNERISWPMRLLTESRHLLCECNQMSNKRIDLTQFEEIEARIKQCQKGFYPAEDLLQELAHHAPSLLAELKRCYEEIDSLKGELAFVRQNWNDAVDDVYGD